MKKILIAGLLLFFACPPPSGTDTSRSIGVNYNESFHEINSGGLARFSGIHAGNLICN